MPRSTEEPINFPEWIESIAAMSGLKIEKVSKSLVVVRCELSAGRSQIVWISPVGKDPHDNTIISIASPAKKMGAGQLLSQKKTNDLLRQNSKLLHGAWAIENIEGDDYLAVFDTQIAQSMDNQEFAASVRATATLAAEMENSMGKNGF